VFCNLPLFDAGKLQQMIVGCALFGIGKDFAGANDPPEFQPSLWVAGIKVGVGPFGGSTESSPESLSRVLSTLLFYSSTLHLIPLEIPAANLPWRTDLPL
jgi:hypothetical protein